MNGCVFPNARQCSARSKRTGCRCRAPAVSGWSVCRFHGARGGQPAGPLNPRFSHGRYTRELQLMRRSVIELLARVRRSANDPETPA